MDQDTVDQGAVDQGAVEQDGPLVRDVFPDLTAQLVRLLEDEGEPWLALCAYDLRLLAECGCGDDFCQSFLTHRHPPGTPYGPGHRMVALDPGNGFLNLDVVEGRIVYVELVDRPPLRRASPQPSGGAEAEHPDS
ncbi:hypothetical protein ABZY81_27160 [Streptomyces sp. NPDC006514]|uniref:hypothetical protein n=1 Tax=Streptomyces sp. NPDC006514 TaxID=3154308 RepID=UPI00339FD969